MLGYGCEDVDVDAADELVAYDEVWTIHLGELETIAEIRRCDASRVIVRKRGIADAIAIVSKRMGLL